MTNDSEYKNSYGARSFIIYPHVTGGDSFRSPQNNLEEICNLSQAIKLEIVKAEIVRLRSISPSHFIGKGKVEEIAGFIRSNNIELAVIDATLSPIQQRNLEKAFSCKVIDRTALILEIFGERASTKEGVLQVQLAHLEYQKSRLVRSWTHLERQRGGGGFMGGPGERQIESDRRIINDNITRIKRQLEAVKKTRSLHRKSRKKVPYPIVALVGYTNAGKSTLFNRLTGASVYAEDALFATLDPTMRKVMLPSKRKIILSDTVGFISKLPTELVAAFRATLEEVVEADLILHVRDIHSPDSKAQKEDVLHILEKLVGRDTIENNLIEVQNKIDLTEEGLTGGTAMSADSKETQQPQRVRISAVTGHGIDDLLHAIDNFFEKKNVHIDVELHVSEGKKIAWLYQHAENVETHITDDMIHVTASMSYKNAAMFRKMHRG